MDQHAIGQWLAVLDALSYYDLFGVGVGATYDEVRRAFHAFCESFHPDIHRWRPASEQAQIGVIYRRGTEGYRVLSDPGLRARYDEALSNGIVRPENLILEMTPRHTSIPPAASGRLVDTLRNVGARPFVLRAEELLKGGDPKQAKLQFTMAAHMEKDNPALEAFGKQLDDALKAKADHDRKNWAK